MLETVVRLLIFRLIVNSLLPTTPSTRALAAPAAVHARLTVNRVVWRSTWAIADHSEDHTPHPADQGLHFERILP